MRHYAGSALMLFVTMAAAVGSYTVNLKVSAERSAVDDLRRQIVADGNDMRDLQAELRTRARLPEMQRWNDNVLMMAAPAAGQYLRSPVQLAGFGVAPAPAEPALRYAVTVAVPTAPAPVLQVAYERPAPAIAVPAVSAPDTARIIRASYPAKPRPAAQTAALTADIAASLETPSAPHDLLPEGGQ